MTALKTSLCSMIAVVGLACYLVLASGIACWQGARTQRGKHLLFLLAVVAAIALAGTVDYYMLTN